MGGYISESESQIHRKFPFDYEEQVEEEQIQTNPNSTNKEEQEEEEVILWRPELRKTRPAKRAPQVCLEGFVESSDDDVLPRAKSLTDDDLDELKGCLDLGFGFSYDEIPELCNTLPALELCYSMSQKFLEGSAAASSDTASFSGSESSSPVPTWKISSPGDHPEDVKARLKFWAQAVACTVKLCS